MNAKATTVFISMIKSDNAVNFQVLATILQDLSAHIHQNYPTQQTNVYTRPVSGTETVKAGSALMTFHLGGLTVLPVRNGRKSIVTSALPL
jgi:hypothetical protein